MSKVTSDHDENKEEKKLKKREKSVVQTKVVIRRLPPGLTEEQFIELIGAMPPHDYFRFVSGDRSLAPNNFCRAYINFLNVDDILRFRDRFDGFEFEFKNGQKHPCVVEFAPFQKVPKKNKRKEDSKVDTIDQDSDYQKFLETLSAEEEKEILDVEKYLEELEGREKKNHKMVETPLTAFLKLKRDERKKIRDERRRTDLERRKKKEEERKKRREVEKRKKLESDKIKRKKEVILKENGKKTLGETRPDPPSPIDPDPPSSSKNEDSCEKLKILQKNGPNEKSSKSKRRVISLKSTDKERYENISGMFSNLYLEQQWSEEVNMEWPNLNEAGDLNTNNDQIKGPKSKPNSTKEFYHKKWKDDDLKKSKPKDSQSERSDDRYKSKKPDLEIYRPGSPASRGGGYRPNSGGGRGSRPQKYSEQRNKAMRKSESEK
uniref:UPF3 domain-containing protein n=1 Tax=Ciona savignyi TaxID=51511 RepID=H2ZBY5_CIOSA